MYLCNATFVLVHAIVSFSTQIAPEDQLSHVYNDCSLVAMTVECKPKMHANDVGQSCNGMLSIFESLT